METRSFDYYLPPELIAQTPVEPRDASRLLVVHRQTGQLEHRVFRDIVGYLRPGDLLVCNDSRVIPARIFGRKAGTGGKVEVLLVAKRGPRTWEALVRGRRIREGTVLIFGEALEARVVATTESGSRILEFAEPVEPHLQALGVVPLPPYIHEPLRDPERYQTVYARVQGSVAAPTAGLHFTPALLDTILAMGCEVAFVTLHIGMDTFRPIGEEHIEEHRIHTEWCEVRPEVAERVRAAKHEGRRVIAVGTTAVRALESAAQSGEVAPFAGPTGLYIYPGYTFRAVDVMITNFHLPRSTLLLLVSAFAGKALIDRAYQEAIRERYRFYSFGDAMLIL
ncbi:MAG: tRNA preQ1(34) S-adenosylmethionine ribosyltransferase-isomerase QueA [Chloroflexi bacterium]|nr:tRNA preQ1(34) S-adenosylmethionine ribosyltransferase-isomerase QueA [Chloroflexota bacterium]